MRLIEKKDIEKINANIISKIWENSTKDTYYKICENNDEDLEELDYKSLPELEAKILKINENIDKKLLRVIALTSVKARAKYERELDEGLYEYAEEHKNDVPAFIYVF